MSSGCAPSTQNVMIVKENALAPLKVWIRMLPDGQCQRIERKRPWGLTLSAELHAPLEDLALDTAASRHPAVMGESLSVGDCQ